MAKVWTSGGHEWPLIAMRDLQGIATRSQPRDLKCGGKSASFRLYCTHSSASGVLVTNVNGCKLSTPAAVLPNRAMDTQNTFLLSHPQTTILLKHHTAMAA